MTKLFDYPENWPTAHSNKSLPSLATDIHKELIIRGANVHLLNASNPNVVGWDKVVQSTGFNVQFKKTDYGCELWVYVWEEDESTLAFLYVWKAFVDKGLVWGGPYKSTLGKPSKEIKPIALTHPKNVQTAPEIKDIILKALRQSKEAEDVFVLRTIDDVANSFFSDDVGYIIEMFSQEWTWKTKKQKFPGPKFDAKENTIGDFVKAPTLRGWKNK